MITSQLLKNLLFTAFAVAIVMPASAASEWEFEVSPYLWMAGVDGDVDVQGESFDISADFEDILDQTKFGGAVILEANRGHWINFVQLDYLALENDDVRTRFNFQREDFKLEVDTLLATLATGYRMPIGERHSVDLMVGLRYAGIDLDFDLNARGELNESRDVYDGIFMVRSRVRLGEHWHLMPSFSIGGGDSDLTWEVFPELIYQPNRVKFRLGYRNLNYDNEKGSDEIDFSMRGVLLGVGLVF